MPYQRIIVTADLPPAGPKDARTREKADIDFKRYGDDRKPAEMAKDVAAFANQLGGVIVIGGDSESDKTQLSYPGIPEGKTAEVVDHCEKAAARCSPAQVVDVIPLKGPDGTDLVAVNVNAFAGQLVASPGFSAKDGGIVQDAWKFPIRRASQTEFISPENLAMYMDRSVRTAFLLLSQIPPGSKVRIYSRLHPYDLVHQASTFNKEGAVEVQPPGVNFFKFEDVRIPLGDVLNVWPASDQLWVITVLGSLKHPGKYVPILDVPRP